MAQVDGARAWPSLVPRRLILGRDGLLLQGRRTLYSDVVRVAADGLLALELRNPRSRRNHRHLFVLGPELDAARDDLGRRLPDGVSVETSLPAWATPAGRRRSGAYRLELGCDLGRLRQ